MNISGTKRRQTTTALPKNTRLSNAFRQARSFHTRVIPMKNALNVNPLETPFGSDGTERGLSSAVERVVHIDDVRGSSPLAPTTNSKFQWIDAARFWSKVDIPTAPRHENLCWIWKGSTGRRGYGQIKIGGSPLGAHRVAFEIANGEPPAGALICHRCDTPLCCNPHHLYAGTPLTNARDMVARNRNPTYRSFKAT